MLFLLSVVVCYLPMLLKHLCWVVCPCKSKRADEVD